MTVQRAICPCCGYDLINDQPILIDDFAMWGAGYPLFFKGHQVRLTPQQSLVCWAILKAYPSHASTTIIMERCGYDGDAKVFDGIVKVHVHRIRKALVEIGAPNVIKTVPRGRAYVWEPKGVGDEVSAEMVQA